MEVPFLSPDVKLSDLGLLDQAVSRGRRMEDCEGRGHPFEPAGDLTLARQGEKASAG